MQLRLRFKQNWISEVRWMWKRQSPSVLGDQHFKKDRLVWRLTVNKERQERRVDAPQVSQVTEVDIFPTQSLCLMHQTSSPLHPSRPSSEEGSAPPAGGWLLFWCASHWGWAAATGGSANCVMAEAGGRMDERERFGAIVTGGSGCEWKGRDGHLYCRPLLLRTPITGN